LACPFSLDASFVYGLARAAIVTIATKHGQSRAMKRTKRNTPHRHLSAGARIIERTLCNDGTPVIGLHLYMAYGCLARSVSRGSKFAAIKPSSIGIPALLKAHPGLSQTELADLMGIERMTAGAQVERCIRAGLVRRERSLEDRRKYELHVTSKGVTNLRRIGAMIPLHERQFFGRLSRRERGALHRLLRKLLDASGSAPVL
jgi:DNA-binding MarR family transcriptional regulator